MKARHLVAGTLLVAAVSALGCAGIEVGRQVQAGRNALQTGRPQEAAAYLMQAAESEPDYRTPFRLPQSVLTYLGRAYYEIRRDPEAQSALQAALEKNRDDHLAHLYLGLTRVRNGDAPGGRREVEAGLQGIHETLEYLAADNVNGIFWDPARRLRGNIESTLMSADNPVFVAAAEQVGRDFDEEMDTARREEGRHRNGRGGGGGD
ncbi:MAG TPA: tetratricopeptide repeat protein [Candidatus Binatia bacterium]|nr:tetratricopeptide repeat protein [Candidatus Binatia bacterium]